MRPKSARPTRRLGPRATARPAGRFAPSLGGVAASRRRPRGRLWAGRSRRLRSVSQRHRRRGSARLLYRLGTCRRRAPQRAPGRGPGSDRPTARLTRPQRRPRACGSGGARRPGYGPPARGPSDRRQGGRAQRSAQPARPPPRRRPPVEEGSQGAASRLRARSFSLCRVGREKKRRNSPNPAPMLRAGAAYRPPEGQHIPHLD